MHALGARLLPPVGVTWDGRCWERTLQRSIHPEKRLHVDTSRVARGAASSQVHENGTVHQASTRSDQAKSNSAGKFEMYIATTVKPGQKGSSALRRVVPPPRGSSAAAMQNSLVIKQDSRQTAEVKPSAQHEAASVTQQKAAAQNRAVRAELASLTTQLKSKTSQLGKADTALRQRDTEIAALRTTLSERDSNLQDSRSELAELHAQIKDSEDGLQQAYNQLAEASRDRARVRQQLLQNQAELSGVHNQLTEWSQDLHQLKSIMDTLEEEDQVISQSQLSGHSQPSSGNAAETKGNAGSARGLRELTQQVKEKTDTALSAANQSPQDGMALLEGIAELSTKMVGEAQQDAELFNRAGKGG